ncbi:MAG: hypothetical protein C4522_09325, partial [Desulfobacteraceae bacterium]
GGGIKLAVGGTLNNDGAIRANGNNGSISGSYSGGGGSGGFIHLTIGTLTGTGSITANGGNGGNITNAGGGAGGRIALYYYNVRPSDSFNMANIRVNGGDGKNDGGASTIYIPEIANTFITNNNGKNFTTAIPELILAGTCQNSTNLIFVNNTTDGVSYTAGDTTWNYPVTLTEGINTFAVYAQNEFGIQSGVTSIQIILDTTPAGAPIITTNTGGDFTTQNSQVVFAGTCTADTVQILVNGTATGVTYTPGATTWSYTGVLAIGENIFTVTAIDGASNVSPADTIKVTFENTLPTQPQNQLPVNGALSVNTAAVLGASEFSDSDSDTHAASQWQIRAASGGYTEPVFDSNENTANLTQITIPLGSLAWSTTYYWHVRYKDSRGSWSAYSDETSFTTVQDNLPPEAVTQLRVSACQDTSLDIAWEHSLNSTGDLASYRVYINGSSEFNEISSDINNYQITGLTAGTQVEIRVTTVDLAGNEDAGAVITGCTLLANPANLSASPRSKAVTLSWDSVPLSQHYYVYAKVDSSFSSINEEGVARVATVQEGFANVSGLTNGSTWYFAVTSENISGCERLDVTTVSAVPSNQMIAHYTMDNINGSTLVDEIGNHNGVLYGNTQPVPGYIDNAMNFDGSGDWIGVDTLQNAIRTGDDITISCWFKTTASKSDDWNNIIFSAHNSGKTNLYRVGTGDNGGVFHAVYEEWNEYGSGWNNGVWHHLAVIQYSTGSFKIYVDNILRISSSKSATPWNNAVYYSIGQEWDTNPSDFFTGQIDELKIFNYALSVSEISALYVDMTPPELVSTNPADGSEMQLVNQIVFTLSDRYGTVNDSVVTGSVVVTDGLNQQITGSVTESNNQFTFTPDVQPLSEGTYTVSFTAADEAGNTKEYSFDFTVDNQEPTTPSITGGLFQPLPVVNQSSTTSVTLTGGREDNTSVWINGVRQVVIGSGDWSKTITLNQGDNVLNITCQDQAGNESETITIQIFVDSIAPVVNSITPANNAILNSKPAGVIIEFTEATSGLNLCPADEQNCPGKTTHIIRNNSFTIIPGSWGIQNGNQLVFTPETPFAESIYTVTLQLKDNMGNQGTLHQYTFTVDTIAPPAPVVNPVESPTYIPNQLITGTREPYAAVLVNDVEIKGHEAGTTWSYTAQNLAGGSNIFTFKARDRAGNFSPEVVVEIIFDDIAPPQVTQLTTNGQGSGSTVSLNWSGYDESIHGDVASYTVFQSDTSFAAINEAGVIELGTVPAGTFSYTAQGLTKGTSYYFAVAARDIHGNFDTGVISVPGTPVDIQPPADARNLSVQVIHNGLTFTWDPGTSADLKGYRVCFAQEECIRLEGSTLATTFTKTGLPSATAYLFKVYSYDMETPANESAGISITGYTQLSNPTGLSAVPFNGKVNLTWNPVSPAGYVKHYAVYKSDADFTTASGTPALTTTSTTAQVAGLTNGLPYYFAVTTVNLSNGEDKTVTTISATPLSDSQGPSITNLKIGTIPLVSGYTLEKSGTITLNAADEAGVSRVEFFMNGTRIQTDYSGPEYSCLLDISNYPNGSYTLDIVAYDTLTNSTTVSFSITIALAVPNAPVITQPATGLTTNWNKVYVTGTAEKNTTIAFYINSQATGDQTTATAQGGFSFTLTLAEGQNSIQASAANASGTGPLSAPVVVTLDTTFPAAPASLSAETREGGIIRLTWLASASQGIAGYNLYRAAQSFTSPAGATKVNTNLITGTLYNDMPATDGLWYYRVAAVNQAQNQSDLSPEISAKSDSTGPRAVSIQYMPQGNVDPVSGAMAPGRVDIVLAVNEPLQATPFFSITPDGGVPISINLTKNTDLTYTGFFTITESTPSTTAYAVFSGRDIAGNRGTEIDAGASILIDTDGPAVNRLIVFPISPIKNNSQSPAEVQVTIGLSEKVKAGTQAELSYTVTGATTAIPMTAIETQSGDKETWQGSFTLPSTAGSTPESLEFTFTARDSLDNVSHTINANTVFQIYQGDLPPLNAPTGLTAEPLPGGKILLSWNAVENAIGYQLFRKAPGEVQLTEHARIDTGLTYTDQTPEDGAYTYAVASIRSENGEESLSGLSESRIAIADATPPAPPTALLLDLIPQGIRAQWTASVDGNVTYAFYRAGSETISIDQAHLIQDGFAQTSWIDFAPSASAHWYMITALDEIGNESAPCTPAYLDFALLPVSAITIVQQDYNLPVITWTHPESASIDGYNLYLGTADQGVNLNSGLLTTRTYSDIGYSGDTRTYTLVAVNDNNNSLPRSLTLPKMSVSLSEDARLKRGIMNRLLFQVENHSGQAVSNAALKINIDGKNHTSETFSINANQNLTVPVVVGGYSDLPDVADLTATLEITPNGGELVKIIRSSYIEVDDGMLILQILNEEFTRGATGKVGFTLKNTGEEEIEIITATNSNKSASNKVYCYLKDKDGNTLSTKAFKQTIGDYVIGLSNGYTVARIPAGETFTSDLMEMTVPVNAPDNVDIVLAINNIHYKLGQTGQVTMNGLVGSREITLIETSYYGEVTNIAPQVSTGNEDIIITGRAIERSTGEPLANVPLNLVITVKGFERKYEVYTDEEGVFTYTFKPLSGEAGSYQVRAVHPDLRDRPVHGTFVISRVSVSPTTVNMNISRNYKKSVNINVGTSQGTSLSNVHLVYNEADQPGGAFPTGVNLTVGSPKNIGSGSSANLPFTIWADNTAANTAKMILRVVSGDGTTEHSRVTINASFSDAKPVLNFTPNSIVTGVAWDDTVTEAVTLKNNGLGDMNNVVLSLHNQDGSQAPSWIYLNSARDQGTIEAGESRKIDIAASPVSSQTPEGNHTFYLKLVSSNYAATKIYISIAVTQSGIGDILFKVSDIYTGTIGANNQPIQGLAGAKIWVQNELVTTETATRTTDTYGEILFADLPSGRYKYRITANNHQEQIGRFWIKPGVTASEDVFLDYNLVTVEWEVTEITIQDKYEITLNTTFETNVPAAVVIASPSSVSLPRMKAGDVYNGEFTLTNHGLIRADNLTIAFPTSDNNFKYEILGGIPAGIAAKARITIPYKITCLVSLEADDEGTGGGCSPYVRCGKIDYDYICANGKQTESQTTYCVTYTPTCSSVSGGTPPTFSTGGGSTTVNDGTSGGSVSNPAPAATPLGGSGLQCYPPPGRKECDLCKVKANAQNQEENTGSSVHTRLREYNRDETDLSVKSSLGSIEVKRFYRNGKWYMGFSNNDWSWPLYAGPDVPLSASFIKFYLNEDPSTDIVTAIIKDGVVYNLPPESFAMVTEYGPGGEVISREYQYVGDRVYRHETYKITGEYHWETKTGIFRNYDTYGRLTAHGNRNGTIANFIYEEGANGRLIGIADAGMLQTVWFEYNTQGLIAATYTDAEHRVEYTYANGLLTMVKDISGYETSYEYDAKGRLKKTVDPEDHERIVSYYDDNGVSSVLDENGKGFYFEYDYNKSRKEYYAGIRSTSGRFKEVWYDEDGDTKKVDINGRTIQKIVKDGRSLIITDEGGNTTREEYDEWDNLTRIVHPDGSVVTNEYERNFNRLEQTTDESGTVTAYAYDNAGNMIQKTEAQDTPDERVTQYTYDTAGHVLTSRRIGNAGTPDAETVMTYDAKGNLTSITDAEGKLTQFTAYDHMGNVLTKIDPRGKTWTYTYDDMGRIKTVTDPSTGVTEFFYDKVGNKIKEIDAEGHEKLFAYDSHDNLIRTTLIMDPAHPESNLVTTFEYNSDNKLVKQTDPEGNRIQYVYDNEGRLLKTIDGSNNEISMEYNDGIGSGCSSCSGGGSSGQVSRTIFPTFEREYSYDIRGRKTAERDILGTDTYTTGFAYDPAGNLLSKTDKENKTTAYDYDELKRLVKVTNQTNQTNETSYTYDNRDNLISLTDAKGQVTRFEYDRNNRLTKEIRPLGEETTYAYDNAGNLIQKIDAKNQKTGYLYDDTGKLTEIRYYAVSTDTAPFKTVTFTYDNAGNLTGYDDGTTSAIYDYDNAYRKLSETVNFGPFTKTNNYTYLKNGLKQTFTGPDNVAYGYLYDANNQLTGVQIPNLGFVTVGAYQWNRPTSITLPGGSTRQYQYDPLMRVKSIVAKDPGQNNLLNYQYAYDKMDNITEKTTEHGNYDYGYDDLYRLITADNPVQDDEAFTYDAVGNRLTSTETTGTWSYNQNNELGGFDDTSYVYDDNGNMVQKTVAGVVTNYVYNTEDRLTEVRDGSGSLISSYYYDPFGRRLWKEVGGTRTYFHYADEGLIGEYDATGVEIKTYGYKPGSTWTTDPLFMKVGGEYYFYHNDHLGTPQKMTGVNGAVVWSAKYESFGKADVDAGSTVVNNLRFPGQYEDAESGLYYNYHRYYDFKTGRYLRADPTGFLGGSNNLYTYVSNMPIRKIDPLGLWEYEAYCRYISGGEGIGGAVLKCHITGPCMRNNKRQVWLTRTILVGFTAGSPGSWTYFSMTLNDGDWSPDPPDGSKLLGYSSIFSAGGAVPSFGGSYSDVRLGSAYYEGTGEQTGVDGSVDQFWGYTTMNPDVPVNNWEEDCCYGEGQK